MPETDKTIIPLTEEGEVDYRSLLSILNGENEFDWISRAQQLRYLRALVALAKARGAPSMAEDETKCVKCGGIGAYWVGPPGCLWRPGSIARRITCDACDGTGVTKQFRDDETVKLREKLRELGEEQKTEEGYDA